MAAMMDAEEGGAPSVPQTSGKVDMALVEKAVDALLKWNGAQKQNSKVQLLEDDQLLYVVVAMDKLPEKAKTNACSVRLPHPLYLMDGNHEVCLFISDRANAKQKLDKKTAKERIEKEGLKIAKVIPLSKLKTDYFGFEAKRKLCGSYDVFLADDRILNELPKLLGKPFYKKKKHPIPVRLTRAHWTGQITEALNSTFLYMSGGTCSVVKAARVSQPREEIVENVKTVIEGVAQLIPQKWTNIRSLFLKTLASTALPVYQSLPVMPLKIELPGLSQPEVHKISKSSKKARLVEDKKDKVSEGVDQMDVVQEALNPKKSKKVVKEAVVSQKSKKRKQNVVEDERKVPRKGKVAT